ncbi:MAG: alpha-ribazole phosphatase [Spirochaetes bacterium]|nr:alpha-ribazole phosphatase [Spirochaetota bacterium]
MFEILLIRHGETDFNKSKRFTGVTDADLNDKGRQQALKLTNALKDEVLDHIYSSDLKRCVETGEHLKSANGRTFSRELREMNFGRWEGLTYNEIKSKYPEELEKWESDWTDYVISEGESFGMMSNRVIKIFNEIIKKHNKDGNEKIAIVSHSGCIRTILGHCITGSIKNSWRFRVENAAVSRLCIDKDYFYLKSLNEEYNN